MRLQRRRGPLKLVLPAAPRRTFDNKLARRRFGEYQEDYGHGGDSAGIHGSGAGFEKMDGLERWVPPEF